MTHPPVTICPVAFGHRGAGWLAMWCDFFRRTGSTLPVYVITDGYDNELMKDVLREHLPGHADAGLIVQDNMPCDLGYADVMGRNPHPQHLAGWLKIMARKHTSGPVLACDCDLVFRRDPRELTELLQAGARHPVLGRTAIEIAMAPDPWPRTYDFLPELEVEHNGGLLWLDNPHLADAWLDCWREHYSHRLASIPWADEIITSLLWQQHGGTLIDPTWNCCRGYGWHIAQSAATFHGHGRPGKNLLIKMHIEMEEFDNPKNQGGGR